MSALTEPQPATSNLLGATLLEFTYNIALQIASDRLTKIAETNWSSTALAKKPPPKFQASIVDDIYSKELHGDKDEPPTLKRIMVLEISQFLENYLWPHFDAESASPQHVMAIAVMINEKFRENVPAWAGLTQPGKVRL